MIRQLFAVSFLAAGFTAVPAHAENWRVTSYTEEYPALVMFADTDSISRNGNNITFTAQTVFETDDKGRGTRSVEIIKASCSDYSFNVMSATYYNGRTFLKYADGPTGVMAAKSGSLDEGTLWTVCGKQDYETQRIDDPWQYADDWFYDLSMDDY